MKTKWVYTEVRNEVLSCEVQEETDRYYKLICYSGSENIHLVRVKTECFTNKKKAKEYFK